MIKFAIIGCGRIASRHAKHISHHGELVGVCDIEEEKVVDFGRRYNCEAFLNYRELLKKSNADVVSICTPNGLHVEHTIASLRSGFHTLCEKPMALSVEDCDKMIQESQKFQKELLIVKQNRFNPPVVAIKQVIDEGRLGKILSVQLNCFWNRNEGYYENSWKGTKLLDGGILYTQFSHFIDLIYWLVGDVRNSTGLKGNYLHGETIEFEDQGVVILEFQNGAIGTINYSINSYGKNMEGSIAIFGEKGTVKVGGQYLNELEYQNIEGYSIEGLPKGNPANNYGEYQGSMSNHGEVYANLVEVLKGKEKIATSGLEGRKTVEIIEKIYNSSEWLNSRV